MEDVRRKNERLKVLLAENQLLKQQTQEQEEQVAELKQELEGDGYLYACGAILGDICLSLRERKSNEEVVH